MSLGYVGRLCVRAAQAGVRRAEQKQSAPRQPAVAAIDHHQPPSRRVSGGLAGAAARTAAEAAVRRRRAEKDERLMNLSWGPSS